VYPSKQLCTPSQSSHPRRFVCNRVPVPDLLRGVGISDLLTSLNFALQRYRNIAYISVVMQEAFGSALAGLPGYANFFPPVPCVELTKMPQVQPNDDGQSIRDMRYHTTFANKRFWTVHE
jgi:hypothetical protein